MTKIVSTQDGPGATRNVAGGYLRVSTRRQAEDGYSLAEQERRWRDFVTRQGWTPGKLYAEAESGRDEGRAQWRRMLADARSGAFTVLVIAKVDRFGRDLRHSIEMKGCLEDAGVAVVAMDMGGMDFSSDLGATIWATLAGVAQMESRAIGRRVSYVAEARAREGKLYGGRFARYGYRFAKAGGYEVVPEHAAIVRRIFREAAAGRTRGDIAKGLNADRIPTQQDGEWHRQNIGRLLRDPTYYGAVTLKGSVMCERGEHQSLVSRDLWKRAQAARAAQRSLPNAGAGRRSKSSHLLGGGLLRCGGCGEPMRARTYPGGKGTYFCDRRADHTDGCPVAPVVDRDTVDARILSYFAQVGIDLDATKMAWATQTKRRIAETVSLREAAEREQVAAQARLTRVRRAFQDDKIDADDWHEQRAELTDELDAATAELARRHDAEATARADAELGDVEEAVLRHLSDLRAAYAREITDAGRGRDATRAALVRLFEGFTLHDLHTPAVPLSGSGNVTPRSLHALTMPPVRAFDPELIIAEGGGFNGQGGYELADRLLFVEPHVRPQAVAGWADAEGLVPVLWRIEAPDPHWAQTA